MATYLATYTYLPFGEVQSTTGSANNPFQYNGRFGVLTQSTGLDFMRARFYLPAIGRFLNADPSGLSGGLNLYTFAFNNPLLFQDPSGRIPPSYAGGYLPGFMSDLASLSALHEATSFTGLVASVGETATYAIYGGLFALDVGIWVAVAYQWNQASKEWPSNIPIVNAADLPPAAPALTFDYAVIGPHDPNCVSGPGGVGTQGFLLPEGTLPYTVGFENESTASAPAVRCGSDRADRCEPGLEHLPAWRFRL